MAKSVYTLSMLMYFYPMKNIYKYITIIFVTTYSFTLSAGSTSMTFNDLQNLDTVELFIGDGDSYCLSSGAIMTEAKYVLNSANIKISKAADVYVEIITNYERINKRDACYGYIGIYYDDFRWNS